MNLEELVGRLKLCCRDLEEALEEEFMGLVLFGSWARGDFGEGSDVDLLVVLKSLKGMEVRSAIYRIIAKHVGRAVTLIDMCAEDLFKDSLELTLLLLNILMDGVVIYDRMGRISKLIAKAGELVEKAGLVRYKTPDGRYGWRRLDGNTSGGLMPISIDPGAEVNYGLRLAENYLKDAEESFKRGGFRDTVASSQLTVENSAKAIYLFLGFQAGPTILPMSLEKLLSKYLLM